MPAIRSPKLTSKSPPPTAASTETAFNNPQTTSTSPESSTTQPKKRTRKAGKRRDYGAELLAHYGSREALLADAAQFDRVYHRLVSPGTQRALDAAERDWVSGFTKLLGSEEAARATLEKDAELPPMELVKLFFQSKTGWSVQTARKYVGTVFTMVSQSIRHSASMEAHSIVTQRARKGAKNPTDHERKQILKVSMRSLGVLALLTTSFRLSPSGRLGMAC